MSDLIPWDQYDLKRYRESISITTCYVCGFQSKEKSNHRRHTLSHFQRQFVNICTICCQEFKRADSYKKHLKVFHPHTAVDRNPLQSVPRARVDDIKKNYGDHRPQHGDKTIKKVSGNGTPPMESWTTTLPQTQTTPGTAQDTQQLGMVETLADKPGCSHWDRTVGIPSSPSTAISVSCPPLQGHGMTQHWRL
jgi:hypothetical protein